MSQKIIKSASEWKRELSPEQFHVTQEKGTEPAFSGTYWNDHRKGAYHCTCCDAQLFHSSDKFDSGTGWPSFSQPTSANQVRTEEDRSHFMSRTEVLCNRCDAHLGHVFEDGPGPSGLRYCINSAALKLNEEK